MLEVLMISLKHIKNSKKTATILFVGWAEGRGIYLDEADSQP
jgi:hypothetical protein